MGSRATGPSTVTLIDGPTISVNASAGRFFRVTLGGNRALAVPVFPVDGQTMVLAIKQDSAGSRTLTLPTGPGGFSFGTDAPISAYALSTAPGLVDYLTAVYNSAAALWHVVGLIRGF